jgi:hydroxyacylglutathione hydrolase
MMKSRREFLADTCGLGLGSLILGTSGVQAGSPKAPPGKPGTGLIFETVFTEGLAHLSYLVGDKATGRATVIDPRRDVEVYLGLARKHKLAITHAIETHNHADFVSGCRELADRTGTARVYLSAEGGARYGYAHEPLRDGQKIDLGRAILTARHTPGHTPEHMAYVVSEDIRPDHPWGVFSGDCLFADSVGRPDLAGEDKTQGLAKALYRSLHEVFLKFGDDVRVHPAHGAGSPCGANISDRLITTIGYERRFNPALQFSDEASFSEFVLATSPPEPRYYRRTKKVNADGPEVLVRLPSIPPMAPRDFREAVGRGDCQLIDNRQMLAFGGGHIAGALNIGPRAELSIWAGWMLDPKRPILLVLQEDSDLPEVLSHFIRVGFSKFAGYLLGGMEAWDNVGLPLETLRQESVIELNQGLSRNDCQVLDVRTPQEWDGGHVPGASYIFLPELAEKSRRLDKNKPMAIYCDSGYRASLAASFLKSQGFDQVRSVPGSWKAWKAAGLPVEQPKEHKKASDTDR